jgi:hypothetical protein
MVIRSVCPNSTIEICRRKAKEEESHETSTCFERSDFVPMARGSRAGLGAASCCSNRRQGGGAGCYHGNSPPSPVPERLILKEGADVNLEFSQDLSSKTAAEDDPINLVLDQDLED